MTVSLHFRPGNLHCIHVDYKAPPSVHSAVRSLVDCYNARFANSDLFIVKRPLSVYWGHITVLDADLMCLEELLE